MCSRVARTESFFLFILFEYTFLLCAVSSQQASTGLLMFGMYASELKLDPRLVHVCVIL